LPAAARRRRRRSDAGDERLALERSKAPLASPAGQASDRLGSRNRHADAAADDHARHCRAPAALRSRAGDCRREAAAHPARQPEHHRRREAHARPLPGGGARSLHAVERRAAVLARAGGTPVSALDEGAADAALVRSCLDGDPAAWSAVMSKYKRLIYSIPIKYGAQPDDAADIFQAVCTALIAELPRLRRHEAL